MKYVARNISLYKKFALGITLVVCCMLRAPFVSAQEILPLIVAPARQELVLSPGAKSAAEIRFYNQGDVPVTGLLRVVDFIVEDKLGTPRLIEDATQASPRFSAASWFKLPSDTITIAANDKVIVQAQINVPTDARPGGRYTAVFFQPTPPGPQGSTASRDAGSSVSSRIAGLVYIKVPGNITERALVTSFFTKSFWEYGPLSVTSEIVNRGDYHIRPKGVITIKNMFGGKLDQVKIEEMNIFPDTSRVYMTRIGPRWMMGRYQLELTVAYGDKGQVLTATTYAWVFPWKVALIIILALVIVYLLVRLIISKAKSRADLLEQELKHEHDEVEKLKKELTKRND